MRFGGYARIWAVAAAVVVSVAACTGSTDGHGPTPTPASTTQAPVSATPSPTTSPPAAVPTSGPNVRAGEHVPTLKPPGDTDNAQGADAYARFWMASLDWAYATTSSTLARMLYAPSCSGCARFLVNLIDKVRDQGRHFRGGRISVVSSQVQGTKGPAGASWYVDLVCAQGDLKVLSRDGRTISTTPLLKSITFRTWLTWSDSRFVVADWKKVVTS